MTQIHVVIRRVNPALKIDFVQLGHIVNGQFVSLPVKSFKDSLIFPFLRTSYISDSAYLDHSDIPALASTLHSAPGFSLDFFDNTIVFMFDFDLDHDESSSKEEGKGN